MSHQRNRKTRAYKRQDNKYGASYDFSAENTIQKPPNTAQRCSNSFSSSIQGSGEKIDQRRRSNEQDFNRQHRTKNAQKQGFSAGASSSTGTVSTTTSRTQNKNISDRKRGGHSGNRGHPAHNQSRNNESFHSFSSLDVNVPGDLQNSSKQPNIQPHKYSEHQPRKQRATKLVSDDQNPVDDTEIDQRSGNDPRTKSSPSEALRLQQERREKLMAKIQDQKNRDQVGNKITTESDPNTFRFQEGASEEKRGSVGRISSKSSYYSGFY